MGFSKHTLILPAILIVAAFLRFFALGDNPPALFRDEAEKGYTAWSLVRSGGYTELDPMSGRPVFHAFPLFVETPGALTSAIYHYFDAPWVGLFGLEVWAIRAPAALMGTSLVLVVWLLAMAWTGDWRVGLVAAGFAAVSPWGLLFSRWAAQGIFVPVLAGLGLWLFWIGREKRTWACWILSAICFALAAYAYAPARLTIPLLVLALAILFLGDLRKKMVPAVVWAILTGAVLVALIIFQLSIGSERMSRVTLTGEELGPAAMVGRFAMNYLSHFSPGYLFLNGDPQVRHSLPGFGVMLHFEAVFFIFGLWRMALRRNRLDLTLLAWALIAPVPAAMTNEAPHALRSITGLPVASLISGFGLVALWDFWIARERKAAATGENQAPRSARGMAGALAMAFALNTAALIYVLFVSYPETSAPHWQYGPREAFEWIDRQKADEEREESSVYLSPQIVFVHYLTLAYRKIDSARFREEGLDALTPYRIMTPARPLRAWYERAEKGAWFILPPTAYDPSLGRPSGLIYYPGYDEVPADQRPVAMMIFRK